MADQRKLIKTAIVAVIYAIIILLTLSVSTYAWFTSNRTVGTNRVNASVAQTDISLYVGSSADTVNSEVCDIAHVNTHDLENLRPVSTSDLSTFIYSVAGKGFSRVEDEKYIYHGRVYIRAVAEGTTSYSRLALYFENAGDLLKADEGSHLLNAARLGFTFDGSRPVILNLSQESNGEGHTINNTYLSGSTTAMEAGNVLTYSGDTVTPVSDPSIYIGDTVLGENGRATPFAYIDLNRTYAMDIYFYLEGCDPDCSDYVQKDGVTLQLYFSGVAE